jgi:hypothetical protein
VWFMERAQQEERVARNQSLFGAISERVEELNETFVQVTPYGSWITPYGSWICECADTTCQEQIQMTRGEYEALREYPARFAVLPDAAHVVPQVERVVERADHYWVVEKIGIASAEAAELTERSESEGVAGRRIARTDAQWCVRAQVFEPGERRNRGTRCARPTLRGNGSPARTPWANVQPPGL